MSQRRSLGNQKTPLLNHVSEKAATIRHASLRTLLVNLAMARTAASEAASLEKMKTSLKRTLLVNLALARTAVSEGENLEKMRTPQKHQKTILNFDATFAKASDKVAVVVMSQRRSLGNQKTPLLNHVSEKAATIRHASLRTLLVNLAMARTTVSVAASLEKTRKLPQKHQKTILNFDATFAKASDKVAAVVTNQRTSLGNQKTPLLNQVSEKAATIQDASLRTLLVNLAMAKTAESEAANLEKMKTPLKRTLLVNLAMARTAASEAANLEKMKTPPQKYQKTILNFGATFAKASDKVAAVMNQRTSLGNQKTPLLNHVSEKAATIQDASLRTLLVNLAMAKTAVSEAASLEKMTLPQKHQKTILHFDATFAKASVAAAVMNQRTSLGNQKTRLLNLVSEKATMIQDASLRTLLVNLVMAKTAESE